MFNSVDVGIKLHLKKWDQEKEVRNAERQASYEMKNKLSSLLAKSIDVPIRRLSSNTGLCETSDVDDHAVIYPPY